MILISLKIKLKFEVPIESTPKSNKSITCESVFMPPTTFIEFCFPMNFNISTISTLETGVPKTSPN